MAYNNQLSANDLSLLEATCMKGPVPQHIAIIMDGNGRWAKSKNRPRVFGHKAGVKSVREVVEGCGKLGVSVLTLYAFSMENWRRPEDEVSTLMGLLVSSLRQEIQSLDDNNVRLTAIGDLSRLPMDAQSELRQAFDTTRSNTGLTLNLALSYSSRWDIIRAVRKIAIEARSGKISPEDIDESAFSSFLSTASLPEPDLLIRTSGELRLSNFLLWELAYTELYISSCFWPDFKTPQLVEAIEAYQKRERRFGQVSEQLNSSARTPVQEERINAVSNY